MKKSIITAVLLVAISSALAQVNKPAAPQKPQYQPKYETVLDFKVNVDAGKLSNFQTVLEMGGPQAVSQSPQLSAQQATAVVKNYNVVLDSVYRSAKKAFMKFYDDGQKKFTADTLKANKK